MNKKYDIAYYSLGNGLTVCNRAVEENYDYKKVAHIDFERNVTFYDKTLPENVKRDIISVAKTDDSNISASQDQKVFSTPPAKFKVGDVVSFTNDNGVNFGAKTIVGVTSVSYSGSGYAYYFTPTDSPWFAVKEENLSTIK